MTYVITSLCLRDGGCVNVCPVECIVPGKPTDQYPLFYIDPEVCIDCGACVRECPFLAIFPEDEVPSAYVAKGGEHLAAPVGTPLYTEPYDGHDYNNEPVHLDFTRILTTGETIDLTPDTDLNAKFFTDGPGYSVLS
jgi:ferredoxin